VTLARTRGVPWPVAAIATSLASLLVATSGRYGYHRDELYFLACGRHLAWGYPDQPPLVPLVARVMSELAPGSLVVLRLPSALAVGAVVVVTALVARDLGADRPAQTFAAAVMASAGLLLGAGHLMSTTTFGLLAWAVVLWLVVRVLTGGSQRLWPAVGAVIGVGFLDNPLVALLALALMAGVLVAGPRRVLASRWLWLGAVLAMALATPYVVWQARHGWPQLTVARHIAAGGSGTSESRWLLLPFQLVMLGPILAPVWIAGLVRLLRSPALRPVRALGVAWVVLAAVFLVLGGKPYYLAGMLPVLVAAGAQPALDWVRRRSRPALVLTAAFVLSSPAVVIALPVVPVGDLHRTPVIDMNYDAGETVGWPTYVRQIAAVRRQVMNDDGAAAVALTSNYGEAGAIDRYGPPVGIPRGYSGHNGYWWWGPPDAPADAPVVAVGLGKADLDRSFTGCRLARRLDNGYGLDDDEQGAPVWVCRGPRGTWDSVWDDLEALG
jgi:4-amino-4-deoxy-L-arabinose transferase-like glycosyltransferase